MEKISPPTTNMETKNWWFVDVSPFPRSGIFRFQPLVFGGVPLRICGIYWYTHFNERPHLAGRKNRDGYIWLIDTKRINVLSIYLHYRVHDVPWKGSILKRKFIFQPSIFRGYLLVFRGIVLGDKHAQVTPAPLSGFPRWSTTQLFKQLLEVLGKHRASCSQWPKPRKFGNTLNVQTPFSRTYPIPGNYSCSTSAILSLIYTDWYGL